MKWITYLMYSRSIGSARVVDEKRCPKFTTPSKIMPVRLRAVTLAPLVRWLFSCSPSSWSTSLVKNGWPDSSRCLTSSIACAFFIVSCSREFTRQVEVFDEPVSGWGSQFKNSERTAVMMIVVEVRLEEIGIWVDGQEALTLYTLRGHCSEISCR